VCCQTNSTIKAEGYKNRRSIILKLIDKQMNYDLNRLNPNEFEQLIQSLLKKIIGQGTITFGQGPDGGREATYEGSAPYPSETNRWNGKWIFQAKFHNTYENAAPARKKVLYELGNELEKIKTNFRTCDNYILATNVSLTSARDTGTFIDEIRFLYYCYLYLFTCCKIHRRNEIMCTL
jgi:hypothetical protein